MQKQLQRMIEQFVQLYRQNGIYKDNNTSLLASTKSNTDTKMKIKHHLT